MSVPDFAAGIEVDGLQEALNTVDFPGITMKLMSLDIGSIENTINMVHVSPHMTNAIDPSQFQGMEQAALADEQAIQHDFGY